MLFNSSGFFNANETLANVQEQLLTKKPADYDYSIIPPIVISGVVSPFSVVPQFNKAINQGKRYMQDPTSKSIVAATAMQYTGNVWMANLVGGSYYPSYSEIDGSQEVLLPGQRQGSSMISSLIAGLARVVGAEPVPYQKDRANDPTWRKMAEFDALSAITPKPYGKEKYWDGRLVKYGDWNEMKAEARRNAYEEMKKAFKSGEIMLPISEELLRERKTTLSDYENAAKGSRKIEVTEAHPTPEHPDRQQTKIYIAAPISFLGELNEQGKIGEQQASRKGDSEVVREFARMVYARELDRVYDKHKVIRPR